MVGERRVTVLGLVGGALVIGGGRVPRLSTAYLLLSLVGLTVFSCGFWTYVTRATYIDIDIFHQTALAAVRY